MYEPSLRDDLFIVCLLDEFFCGCGSIGYSVGIRCGQIQNLNGLNLWILLRGSIFVLIIFKIFGKMININVSHDVHGTMFGCIVLHSIHDFKPFLKLLNRINVEFRKFCNCAPFLSACSIIRSFLLLFFVKNI